MESTTLDSPTGMFTECTDCSSGGDARVDRVGFLYSLISCLTILKSIHTRFSQFTLPSQFLLRISAFKQLLYQSFAMASKLMALLALAIFPALSIAAAVPEAAAPVADVDNQENIVGGSAATAGQFPYQVALLHDDSLFCGGVLLNANTVLTAGHCSVDYAASTVSVRAGSLVCYSNTSNCVSILLVK